MQIIALLITRCGCRRRLKLREFTPSIVAPMNRRLRVTDDYVALADIPPAIDSRRFEFYRQRTSKSGKLLFLTYLEAS